MPVISGTTASESLVGTPGADTIRGYEGNDTINGNGGEDDLYGHEGNDTLINLSAEWHANFFGGEGNDILQGRKGAYAEFHFWGGAGNDRLLMDQQNQEYWGPRGFHAYGEEGADRFEITNVAGAQRFLQSRIDDFDASRDSIWLQGVQLDLYNLPSNCWIIEHNGQQWLLIGTTTTISSANVMIGLEGAREFANEEEDHFLWVNFAESDVFENSINTSMVRTFIDQINYVPYALYSGINFGSNRIEATNVQNGSANGDYIFTVHQPTENTPVPNGQGANENLINGLGGNDVINAGHGADTIYGGDGNDSVAGGIDPDQLHGDAGADLIYGGSEADNLYGGAGADGLWGGTGADLVDGGADNDTIYHMNGADTISGGTGIDTFVFLPGTSLVMSLFDSTSNQGIVFSGIEHITGGIGADSLTGNSQNNILTGNDGNDWMTGFGGNDSLLGGAGADTLYGIQGTDTLNGGAGHDWLSGGDGVDVMTGGSGNDQFFFEAIPTAADTITDFTNTSTNNDQFSIRASAFGGGLTGGGFLSASQFVLRTNGTNAGDANDRFIFNSFDNSLWFDVDGTGAAAAVRIATLQSSATDLTAADIFLY